MAYRNAKEWYAERLHLIEAFAKGKKIGCKGFRYPLDTPDFSCEPEDYVFLPDTIIVNGLDVPAPEKVAPQPGQLFYTPNLILPDWVGTQTWGPDHYDQRYLERGLVYLKKEHAIARAKAMVGVDPGSI